MKKTFLILFLIATQAIASDERVALGDLDHDGKEDTVKLIQTAEAAYKIDVTRTVRNSNINNRDKNASYKVNYYLPQTRTIDTFSDPKPNHLKNILIIDEDGDNHQDIRLLYADDHSQHEKLWFYKNDGQGNFTRVTSATF